MAKQLYFNEEARRALKRGVDIVAELKSLAKPVRDRADIAHVAAISAADSEIGDLIAEVMEKVGKDGVITVEESKGIAFEKEYTLEVVSLCVCRLGEHWLDIDDR